MLRTFRERKCRSEPKFSDKIVSERAKKFAKEVHFETLKKEKKLSESISLVHFSKDPSKTSALVCYKVIKNSHSTLLMEYVISNNNS